MRRAVSTAYLPACSTKKMRAARFTPRDEKNPTPTETALSVETDVARHYLVPIGTILPVTQSGGATFTLQPYNFARRMWPFEVERSIMGDSPRGPLIEPSR